MTHVLDLRYDPCRTTFCVRFRWVDPKIALFLSQPRYLYRHFRYLIYRPSLSFPTRPYERHTFPVEEPKL